MKIVPSSGAGQVSRGPAPTVYDKAREAVIEKRESAYIELKCAHFTDWDTDEVYSHWRPAKNKHFCELCGTWRSRLSKIKVDELPAEPMF